MKKSRTSTLVKVVGFPATLVHGDSMVLDRWRWLKHRLPHTDNGEALLDVGCGSGAFSIGAALRGYCAIGTSWSASAYQKATERAALCKTDAKFEVQDVRELGARTDLQGKFDVIICTEVIEHIMDDRKLMTAIAGCLKPGARLLMTTPNALAKHLWAGDAGPFSVVEDGGHVRKGYSEQMLQELCDEAGLRVERLSYCTGIVSQELTVVIQKIERINFVLGWLLTLPLRVLPPLLDRVLTPLSGRPYYSICLEAYKPRFSAGGLEARNGGAQALADGREASVSSARAKAIV